MNKIIILAAIVAMVSANGYLAPVAVAPAITSYSYETRQVHPGPTITLAAAPLVKTLAAPLTLSGQLHAAPFAAPALYSSKLIGEPLGAPLLAQAHLAPTILSAPYAAPKLLADPYSGAKLLADPYSAPLLSAPLLIKK